MTTTEAKKIMLLTNAGQLSFDLGEKAYCCYVKNGTYTYCPVLVVAKRESKIGLGDCYSVKKNDGTFLHGPSLKLFKTAEDAKDFVTAYSVLYVREEFKKPYWLFNC